MASVMYLQGRREVIDTLTGVSQAAFGHLLNNLESALPAREKKGQPADLIQGIRDTINYMRPLLKDQATDNPKSKGRENE